MSTYTPIASVTLSASTTSVVLSDIPQNYLDLIVMVSCPGAASGSDWLMRFNVDQSNKYSRTYIFGTGTSTGYNRSNPGSSFSLGGARTNGMAKITIPNYSNYNTNKTVLWTIGSAADDVAVMSGLWQNNNAVTAIEFTGPTWPAGSTFTVHGIVGGSPKADGGNIVASDGTYWYHAFTSSGTFAPKQSLTADIMVIAGGGGGGWAQTGGGGAGGLSAFSSQSLSIQNYLITIGAGGVGAVANAQTVSGSNSSFGALTAAIGGGKGGNAQNGNVGGNGGCGGGAQGANGTKAGGTGSQGNNGGSGSSDEATYRSTGGGGGLGAAGSNGGTSQVGGAGGNGTTAYSSWGLATNTGQNSGGTVYFGGGGGGGQQAPSSAGTGGLGGGGAGQPALNNPGGSGSANTGGGAGSGGSAGGNGGSGIVIVRYAV